MGRISSKSGRPSGAFSGPSPRPPKGQPRPAEEGRKPTPIGNIGRAVGTATPLMKAVGNIARDRKGQVKSSPSRGRTIKGSRPRPDMPSPRPPIRGGRGRPGHRDGDSTFFSFEERERGRRPPMFGGGRDRRPPMFGGGRDRPPEMSGGGRFPPGMIGNRPIVDIGRGGKPPKEGGYIIDWSNWKDPRSQEEIDAQKSMDRNFNRGDGTGFGRPTPGRGRGHIQWEGPGNPSWERKNPNWRDNPRWKDHGAKYRDHQKDNKGTVTKPSTRPIGGGWDGTLKRPTGRELIGGGWDGTLKRPVVPKYRDYGPEGNRVGVRDKSDPIGDAKRAKHDQVREALRSRMRRY